MGELVQETSQDSKTAERASSAASATSRDSYRPAHSLGKPDGVFNSQSQQSGNGIQLSGWRHATPACYSSATPTSAAASQHQSHSTTGSPSERVCQLLRLFYPSFFDWQSS